MAVVVTPAVIIVSQHASAVSDVADVIVSDDYASDDVEWLDSIGGSEFLDSVLASALAWSCACCGVGFPPTGI